MILPPWVATYRKALVLAAVATASGAVAWQANGWRLGKQLAEQQAAANAATMKRQSTSLTDWQRADHQLAQVVLDAKAKLRAQRLANKALVDQVRLATPQAPEYACRAIPLPETYLEKFRK